MAFDRFDLQRILVSALGAVALSGASLFAAAAPVAAAQAPAPAR